MDITSGWDIRLTNDLTGITAQAVTNKRVLTTSDEGSGNGIDADTVDGIQAASFLRSDADDSFSGNLTSAQSKWIKFYHPTQTDSNDGKIGAGVFDTGLNIVGAQTVAGTGRQVRVWGDLITSTGTKYATESYVDTAVSNLVDSAPAALDTLNELAAALGDDASFSTNVTNSIATKLPLSGGTLTGDLRFNQGNGYGRIAFADNYHGMILRGYPGNSVGDVTMGDVTSLVQHSGDFRFYRTNGTVNDIYFQVNSTAAYHRGNQIWDAGDFTATDVANWNTAYGWNNHASAGYLTASSTDLDSRYYTESEVTSLLSNYRKETHFPTTNGYSDYYSGGQAGW